MILGENAIECFGLPGDALRQVAARIGPRAIAPCEVVAHFTARAGYEYEREVVDTNSIRCAVAEDRAMMG